MSPETFATAAGTQTGTCGSSGAAVSVLGLEHNEADHDGDETYGGDHQGEDDGRRRVAQLLDGAVHEERLVDFHKLSLHQRVGPRDQQAVGYLLRAVAQVTVKAAGGGGTQSRGQISSCACCPKENDSSSCTHQQQEQLTRSRYAIRSGRCC